VRPNTTPYGLAVSRPKIGPPGKRPNPEGVALKRAREDAAFTQEVAAEKLGIDAMTLSRYERGLRRPRSDLLGRTRLAHDVP
jgi:DNA-binding XRE family transcriptional regulator